LKAVVVACRRQCLPAWGLQANLDLHDVVTLVVNFPCLLPGRSPPARRSQAHKHGPRPSITAPLPFAHCQSVGNNSRVKLAAATTNSKIPSWLFEPELRNLKSVFDTKLMPGPLAGYGDHQGNLKNICPLLLWHS
jgi:hypothetical protein